MALKLVLRLAQEFGVTQLQIFGDSMLVIQWMHKEIALRNFTLQPLYDEVLNLLTRFLIYIFVSYLQGQKQTCKWALKRWSWVGTRNLDHSIIHKWTLN
jgi:ribonuclease HI